MDELMDISSISFEDLQEEYQKLRERFGQLLAINEQDAQRIHELRRSLETATAAEAYLAAELEQLTSTQTSQDDALLTKKQNEVDDLKKRQSALLSENEELHQEIVDLRTQNDRLNQAIKELTLAARPAEVTYHIPKEFLDQKEKLETENLELLSKLDESHESVVKFTMSIAEKEKHIEVLRDQVLCLEENLQSKREEVEEKSQLLESAQEQVVEMNAKIAMLTSCPDNADRKGNSLFAEVDDQRQAMKQLLASQKKSYLDMKKIFNDSQYEIRRLKRENFAMHNELQACSTIFCGADKTYKEKLNERILQLLKQNEDLEKKLTFTQQELVSKANDKGVVLIDSMLQFCKQETEELKKQNHGIRIQNGLLEDQVRNYKQNTAKWRFEALKSRCIVIDRERLLTENNIEFKDFTNRDVAFTASELENARPNLGFGNNLEKDKHKHEVKVELVDLTETESSPGDMIEVKDEQELGLVIETEREQISCVEEENYTKQSEQSSTALQEIKIERTNISKCDSDQRLKENEEPYPSLELNLANQHIKIKPTDILHKENVTASHFESQTPPKLCAKKPLEEFNPNVPTRPSILITKRDIIAEDSKTKTVHFAPTDESGKSDLCSQQKFGCKSTRPKNIIVRRIQVKSRTKNEPGAP